ncbi:MAG: DUF2764 family protein [Candidatus Omnitrophica bacterium]|nr:DUF2764 family protein [Candidatus Omnitrophota bacterium]
MAEYYYFAAQLPLLQFKEKSFFSRGSFLDEARKWFSPRDLAALEAADIDDFSPSPGDPGALRNYKEFESTLREEVVRYRHAQKNQGDYKPQGDTAAIILEGDPLEKETNLLRVRWDFIEEFEQGHYFDLAFFIAYFLKLQIVERLETFNKEQGKEKFTQICEVTL